VVVIGAEKFASVFLGARGDVNLGRKDVEKISEDQEPHEVARCEPKSFRSTLINFVPTKGVS